MAGKELSCSKQGFSSLIHLQPFFHLYLDFPSPQPGLFLSTSFLLQISQPSSSLPSIFLDNCKLTAQTHLPISKNIFSIASSSLSFKASSFLCNTSSFPNQRDYYRLEPLLVDTTKTYFILLHHLLPLPPPPIISSSTSSSTMGGPLWTAPEEEYFWTKVIPFSDKRIGHDQKTQKAEVKTWETLAKEMLEAMTAERAKTGEKPLREYTALTLAEHWDKNVMQDRISKFAQVYVEAYLAEMKQEEGGVRWAKRQRKSIFMSFCLTVLVVD
ncbi:hypothetical protein BR93DRAFT_492263 [Coniochaeta sp. PMI_546]|nr:hypothetical protein BR93DRAFT_492263 [Coniochaeta sp. PMI_546]